MNQTFSMPPLDRLVDFWGRRDAEPIFHHEFNAYGHKVRFSTNQEALLATAEFSQRRYTRSPLVPDQTRINLVFIADPGLPDIPIPQDWPGQLRYLGTGPYLTINKEPWINAFAHLDQRQALALVSPSLVDHPHLLSRYIADCFVLNMLLRGGWGQLHASCVVQDQRAILFSAPHNTGKSTTAYRLVRAGYQLLSDGMTYIRTGGDRIELLGYPVGEVKLRPDVAASVDEFSGQGESVMVREDQKIVLNLHQLLPERVIGESFFPQEVVVCLLQQPQGRPTRAEPITRQAALDGLWVEALHLDQESRLRQNLAPILGLLKSARCYSLHLGTDEKGLLAAIQSL